MNKQVTQPEVFEMVLDAIRSDDSLICLECGATAKWIKRMGEHWCYHCKDVARLKDDIKYTKWDCEENDIMNERGLK